MDSGPLRLRTEAELLLEALVTAQRERSLFGEVRRTSDGQRWRILRGIPYMRNSRRVANTFVERSSLSLGPSGQFLPAA